MTMKDKPLAGKIAVVAGATRGAGRGIATALGEAGATVYCTGRSVPGNPGMKNRPETINQTAEIAVRTKEPKMRVMVMVKATRNSEAGILPGDPRAPAGSEKLFEQMGKFNEELVKAGVMLAGEGLKPSSMGKRVRFTGHGGKKAVIDGPFAETKELVAGYWIWQVRSMEEAIEWVRRCPDPMPGEESEIEIRPIYEAEDFGKELAPELRAQEERLRAEIERQRIS